MGGETPARTVASNNKSEIVDDALFQYFCDLTAR